MRRMSDRRRAELANAGVVTISTLTSSTRRSTAHRTAPLRSRYTPAVPDGVRAALKERSGGWCEIVVPGCLGAATDPAHRIKRGMGGRKGAARKASNQLANLLYACRRCHEECHRHPAWAYERGWMLREGQTPSRVPVLYRGRWALLDDAGGVRHVEPGAT